MTSIINNKTIDNDVVEHSIEHRAPDLMHDKDTEKKITKVSASSNSNFACLFKIRNATDGQEIRRTNMLMAQREDRDRLFNDSRGLKIKEYVKKIKEINKTELSSKHLKTKMYRNMLQYSEWLRKRPEDFHNWYLLPCPKGKRCLVVSNDGITTVFNKYGLLINEFHSLLPGDHKHPEHITILDCIYAAEKFYVLDVLFYNNQDLMNCETQNRFLWIRSRIDDDSLCIKSYKNQYEFHYLEYFNCADDNDIENCLLRFPMWENNLPELDGILFYHKYTLYENGTTPLVTWLLPFMVPEILNIRNIHKQYLNEQPEHYIDSQTFIEKYDKEMAENIIKNKNLRLQRMQRRNMQSSNGSTKKTADDEMCLDEEEEETRTSAIVDTMDEESIDTDVI